MERCDGLLHKGQGGWGLFFKEHGLELVEFMKHGSFDDVIRKYVAVLGKSLGKKVAVAMEALKVQYLSGLEEDVALLLGEVFLILFMEVDGGVGGVSLFFEYVEGGVYKDGDCVSHGLSGTQGGSS